MVKSSPYDKIWGIGLKQEEAMAGGVGQWCGENLLGCALMQVRDYLHETQNDNILLVSDKNQNGYNNVSQSLI